MEWAFLLSLALAASAPSHKDGHARVRRVVEVIAFVDGGLEEPLQHSLHRSQRGYMQEKEEEGLCD